MCDDDSETYFNELNEIAKCRESGMVQNYPGVRDAYRTSYNSPDLDPVRHEVALCLVFGLYQAAVTLTSHLLESLLKRGLIYLDARQEAPQPRDEQPESGQLSDPLHLRKSKSKYVDKDLSHSINCARTQGLITKEQKNRLHWFRENVRNAYLHADANKTYRDRDLPMAILEVGDQGVTLSSQTNASLSDFLPAHGLAQYHHAKGIALHYFLFVDGLARQILAKVFPESLARQERDASQAAGVCGNTPKSPPGR